MTDSGVDRRIYLDPDIYAAELERIFAATWVYVAHESEIAQPREFKTTEIGATPVIVTRDDDGAIRVLVNRCSHRAATVCQPAKGEAQFFRCAYHGWTYDRAGNLTGLPYAPGFGSLAKREQLGLAQAPCVESYRGFIFARMTPDGPTLREHLGRAADYLDAFVDAAPGGGVDARSGRHRYYYEANWKLQLENAVDAYHAFFVHRSFFDIQDRHLGTRGSFYQDTSSAFTMDLGGGHSCTDQRSEMRDVYYTRFKMSPGGADIIAEMERVHGAEGARKFINAIGGNGFNLAIYPNLVLIGVHIRVIKPVSVNRTLVELYPTTLHGLPDRLNRMRLRSHEAFFGPAGFGSPDDMEIFRRIQNGLQAVEVPEIRFWRGLEREQTDGDAIRAEITDETTQRAQYKQWLRLMSARPAPVREAVSV